MCCDPQASDCRLTPKHGYLEYEIMTPYHRIHSLTYCNKPYNSRKSYILNIEKWGKVCRVVGNMPLKLYIKWRYETAEMFKQNLFSKILLSGQAPLKKLHGVSFITWSLSSHWNRKIIQNENVNMIKLKDKTQGGLIFSSLPVNIISRHIILGSASTGGLYCLLQGMGKNLEQWSQWDWFFCMPPAHP